MSQLMKKFEEELYAKALSKIDIDDLAEELADALRRKIKIQLQETLDLELDMTNWMGEILMNPKTKAGKSFEQSVNRILERMVKAI